MQAVAPGYLESKSSYASFSRKPLIISYLFKRFGIRIAQKRTYVTFHWMATNQLIICIKYAFELTAINHAIIFFSWFIKERSFGEKLISKTFKPRWWTKLLIHKSVWSFLTKYYFPIGKLNCVLITNIPNRIWIE